MSVGNLIRNIPLSPAVTGALLYALTRAPDKYRQPLLQRLSKYLSPKSIARAVTTLKWLLALGVARNLHVWLSGLAQNNFRLRSELHRYDWPREVAVVTGAASGFGALISKGLADKGINVMAVDIRDELPPDMKADGKINYYKCDVTNRQDVMDLAEQIRKDHRDPSILINNAGVCVNETVIDISEKDLKLTFDVNLVSHYWTLQAFMPAMIKDRKGHVVATASMASFFSPPGIIHYCNTKAGVLSLHDGLQQETRVVHQAPEIKFTVVHPTYSRTPMVQPFSQELKDKKVLVIDPQIVADAVVNQILSGKGRQIIVGGDLGWLAGIRGWPIWFAQAIIHSTDGKVDLLRRRNEGSV